MYLQILIIYVIIVYLILKNKKSIGLLKMSLWLYLSYSFLLITHLFSGISYNVGNIYRVLPYVIICLFLVILGERYGAKIKSSNVKRIPIKLNMLNIMSILGSAIAIYEMFRLNEIIFGSRIEERQTSILGVIGVVLASLGIIAWLTSFYENRRNGNKIPLLSYLSFLSYIAVGILSAGRQSVIIIALSTLIIYIWSHKKNKEIEKANQRVIINTHNTPWGTFIIAFTCLFYFVFISAVRMQIFDINHKVMFLEKFFNAEISNETLEQIYKTGVFSDIYTEFLFYYSHELIRLDLYYQHYDYPPLFGLEQMPYIGRRVQWLLGNQAEESWTEVEHAIEGMGGFTSHTWGTFITNFIADFGRFGALIASFFIGFVSGVFFRKVRDTDESVMIIARQSLICAGIVFSIQYSPFVELTWAFPLIVSSFIKVLPPPYKGSQLRNKFKVGSRAKFLPIMGAFTVKG